ncbi:MAG: CHRD domain-containing protein [Caulobacteraceae bacterium]|nr:CHRD domain-containing protein [Caulobacteraceae bacterium]
MRTLTLTGLAALALFSSPAAFAEVLHYSATLDGASETPPNTSKASGTADVTLDTESKMLSWTVTYADLSGPASAAHFHGPAAVGVAAGVTVPIPPPLKSPISGSASINDGQIGDLRAGLWYVNVHTAQNPKGEIRGQVLASK